MQCEATSARLTKLCVRCRQDMAELLACAGTMCRILLMQAAGIGQGPTSHWFLTFFQSNSKLRP